MLYISKDQSTIIKGIVILMMLFLHLFNGDPNEYVSLFHVGEETLEKWLTGGCHPVSFFLLLSGYGLAYTYERSGLGVRRQAKRILKLYLHYWVVLLVFVTLGACLKPEVFPGSAAKVLANATGWDCSYVGEMWFLLPYSVVSLLSLYIIRTIERLGNAAALLLSAGIYVCTCYLISRHGDFFFHRMLFYQPLLVVHFLYDFTTGVVLYRTTRPLRVPLRSWQKAVAALVLFGSACIINSAAYYMLYVPLLVILLSSVEFPQWAAKPLTELGRKSMAMWMIHAWFCYYLFHSYTYALRYPPLIFIALVAVSYAVAIPIMWVARRLSSLLHQD